MINKVLPLLLISLLLLPLYSAADAEPKIDMKYEEEITPGRTMTVDIALKNTTSEMLWELKGIIELSEIPESIRDHIQLIKGEQSFTEDTHINVQDEASIQLSFTVDKNVDAGTYTIPIKIKGEIGNCRQGCKPYLLIKNITFKVVKDYPSLKIEVSSYPSELFQGKNLTVPFKIINYGEGYANNIKISVPQNSNYTASFDIDSIGMLKSKEERAVNLNILTNGNTPSGDYKTDIIVEYYDPYGNKKASTQSISFSVKNSAVVQNAENYYAQANTYFESKNYSKALEYYGKAKNAYQEVGLTEKANEIDSRILLVNAAIEESKSNITPSMYIIFGVLLSAVTMELGVLIGTLMRKSKSASKKSAIPKHDY
ncbi:MAG: hypothetical protein GYA51_12410 [Candidatus Methanofastidiosa archaeon]|jgi:hypothetical protein|nr:hypothetical protein [Candidatus Methanofastidiosa archaeon]